MDIPSWAVVGNKVVAKGSYRPAPVYQMAPLEKGKQYVIRAVSVQPAGVGIQLMEIRNPVVMTSDAGMSERYYHVSMFSPVVDTKFEADIAIFKDILLHAHEYRDITETV